MKRDLIKREVTTTINDVTLLEAIAYVRDESGVAINDPTTEEEMARKLEITVEQLRSYIRGDEMASKDLPSRLLTAYRLRIVQQKIAKYYQHDLPDEPVSNSEGGGH